MDKEYKDTFALCQRVLIAKAVLDDFKILQLSSSSIERKKEVLANLLDKYIVKICEDYMSIYEELLCHEARDN